MGVMHPCNYPGCNKQFDRKYNLKCHLRIHSDEKPYSCHHLNCTRSFRWKSSLNHHLMSLDHTPKAARRQKKALAVRRRKEHLTPSTSHRQKAEATATGPHLHAASNFAFYRANAELPHITPLESARALELSDVSATPSGSSLPKCVYRDVDLLNKPLPLGLAHYVPNSAGMRQESTFQQQPKLQMQPPLITTRMQHVACQPPRRVCPSADQHENSPLLVDLYERTNPRMSHPSSSAYERPLAGLTAESSRPSGASSIDSAIESAEASLNLLPNVKKEVSDSNTLIARPEPVSETAPPCTPTECERGSQFSRHSQFGHGPRQALVSIFEDCSPTSVLNTIPLTLDPLFSACSCDAACLKSF